MKEPSGYRVVYNRDGSIKVAGIYRGHIPTSDPCVMCFDTEEEMLNYLNVQLFESSVVSEDSYDNENSDPS